MKLSRREKILLYVAGITVLVSVGLTKAVFPALSAYMDQREIYEAAAAEESLWLQRQETYKDAEDQSARWQEEYRVCRELFPDRMENEEAEGLMLTHLEDAGLTPVSSRILNSGPVTLGGGRGGGSGGDQAKGFAVSFQVEAEGEMEDFVSLLEEMERELYMRLVSFQAAPDVGSGWRFTMELECYMLEAVREKE